MAQRRLATLLAVGDAMDVLSVCLEPVAVHYVPVHEAAGKISGEVIRLPAAIPAAPVALVDGWAFRSRELVGASSYSPVLVTDEPVWVEAGDELPEGCDCVVDAELVERNAGLTEVVAEVLPNRGVRRAGGDMAATSVLVDEGQLIRPIDVAALKLSGTSSVAVRTPRVLILNVPPKRGGDISCQLIADLVRGTGASVTSEQLPDRSGAALSASLQSVDSDLLLVFGGTGAGRDDHCIVALGEVCDSIRHGVSLYPGHSAAFGNLSGMPLLCLPGAPSDALSVYLAFVQPVIDRLSKRKPRSLASRPLVRKIASTVGVSEMVLLREDAEGWYPLATGDWPFSAILQADAWALIDETSEGLAAGISLAANPFSDLWGRT